MGQRRDLHPSAGFTLLEILIAISLVSLIMLVLFSSLRTAAKTWEAGEQQTEQVTDMRVVLDFLRRQLRQAQVVYRSEEGEIRAVFEGDERSLRFVTPIMPHLDQGGLQLVEISSGARSDPVSGREAPMTIRMAAYRPDQTPENMLADAAERDLLSEVGQVEFRFFGATGADDEREWREEWRGAQLMPEMVSMTIQSDERTWPPLYVALPH